MEDIVRFIKEHQRFALTSHARPDGDSIGSALGFAFALEHLGKTADVYNSDPPPRPYETLPGIQKINVTEQIEGDYDALLVLECNDLERPGLKGLDRFFVVNIDHHPGTERFGDLNWLDPTAAAVGEMVFRLIKMLGVSVTPEIATNLYVAILTDTGSFQYSNTNARTFTVASELVKSGANPSAIAQAVYMSQPEHRIQLLGMLLTTLDVHASRKIACITLTKEMLSKTGASADDTEGIVNYPLSINGVQLAAFFREEGEKLFRVSLRSKDRYDVSAVARQFGGGGHKNAAGLRVEGNMEEAKGKVVAALEKLVK